MPCFNSLFVVLLCWCFVEFAGCEPPVDAALEEAANSSILTDDLGDTEHVADTDEFIDPGHADGGPIERAYDASSSSQGVGVDSGKSLLQDTLKTVDLNKLLKVAGDAGDKSEVVRTDNIQRVAKKISRLGDADVKEQRLDSSTEVPMDNVTSSDVLWLARVFSVVSWDPSRLPGHDRLSGMCVASMGLYLRELRNGTVWADKSKCDVV